MVLYKTHAIIVHEVVDGGELQEEFEAGEDLALLQASLRQHAAEAALRLAQPRLV